MHRAISLLVFLFIGLVFAGCEQDEQPREKKYWLYQAGFTPTSGMAVVSDLGDDRIKIEIKLKPFLAGKYPAHVHFGDISELGELALRLEDVDGETGKSVTIVEGLMLSNGEELTFEGLLKMNASIRIHSSVEIFKHVVVAFGNIGSNDEYIAAGLANCTGH